MNGRNSGKRIRYAVVGLGWISQAAVLPAFAHARKNSELAALVSGDPKKLKTLGRKYGVERLYSYDEYEECLTSGEIDAVYIGLPNNLHCEYAVRAARNGIHVLVEKPMAITEAECRDMIGAARYDDVKLMVAYRLHFEEANLKAIDIAQSGKLGELRLFTSSFSQISADRNIRLKRAHGGGPLFDLGVYCINAARYLFQDEPTEVMAQLAAGDDARFKEVEESASVILRFPNERLANFTVSFGAVPTDFYEIAGTKGSLCVDPAYDYRGEMHHYLTINGKTKEKTFRMHDQFAPELAYFSDCILRDREPEPSGLEGLNDIRIIQAAFESARLGRKVVLPELEKKKMPRLEQLIRLPPVREPRLIHADPAAA